MSNRYPTAKRYSNIGVIGSVLSILLFIPKLRFVGLVGLIVTLVALSGISALIEDERPLEYYIYAAVSALLQTIIAIFTAYSLITPWRGHSEGSVVIGSTMMIGGLAILALIIIMTYLIRIALLNLMEKTEVGTFYTAAKLIWYGGILYIFLIGILLIMVGLLVQAIAFSKIPAKIKEEEEESSLPTF